MNRVYPLDLLRQSESGWKISGFPSPMEGEWRSVYGRELKIEFYLPKEALLTFYYTYFPATSPQSAEVWVDGVLETRDRGGAQGYFWRDLAAGPHTVSFIFKNVRSPDVVQGDPRPLSVAFTRLGVAPMYFNANTQWTAVPIVFSSFICLGLISALALVLGLFYKRQPN